VSGEQCSVLIASLMVRARSLQVAIVKFNSSANTETRGGEIIYAKARAKKSPERTLVYIIL